MRRHYTWLLFIVVLTAFSAWVALPDTEPDFLRRGGDPEQYADCEITTDNPGVDCEEFKGNFEYQLGLDLVGGLRVLLQAELPEDAYTVADLQETANNVERRVNALGTSEVTVQTLGGDRILVELPGESDPENAINTIRQTALLEFVDFGGLTQSFEGQRIFTTQQQAILERRQQLAEESGQALDTEELQAQGLVNPNTGQPFQTVMTGEGLSAASAVLDQGGLNWIISFEVSSSHEILHPSYTSFGDYTGSNVNQRMAIVLDGVVLSAPTIQDRLDDGGVITGAFTEDEAKTLALQLRSGSLAIPLRVESTELVGATLGNESVRDSVRAGVIGVIVVFAFMFIYYRVPGISADVALAVFIILNLALFKYIPITLTLPAITGFLISIGTAVDGNILIFERIKEEIRAGKPLFDALEVGFERAWTSIRDSNTSTIIICAILFLFGQTPGASVVAGFAVTLALGLILNLFTAVLVTRTVLYVLADLTKSQLAQRKWLLGI